MIPLSGRLSCTLYLLGWGVDAVRARMRSQHAAVISPCIPLSKNK